MQILEDRDVRVRKRHQCSWCWEMIEHGERCHFQKQAEVGDGIYHVWTHLECVEPEHAWACEHGEDEPRIRSMPRGKEDDDV